MNENPGNKTPEKLVDHLFRHEYGKMVSILIRIFGPSNISLVEDVVQESFIKAIGTWRTGNIPDNPAAWLHKVARNKAIDILRSEKSRSKRNDGYHHSYPTSDVIEELFLDKEIADSQLRLIFTCCDLDLNEGDRIALTLKVISGFGVKAIAKALLLKEETVKKRIQRAKQKLKNESQTFTIPVGEALASHLHTVHTIIYLMFNEGYYSLKQHQLIRKDLCAEAIRLCKLITDHPYCKSEESYALMALMCYHASRLDSRIGTDNEIILLQDQDRNNWYHPLINIGHQYFKKCGEGKFFSIYHIEAAIAAIHCKAESFETTDWRMMIQLYQLLYQVKPSATVRLNLAVALQQNNEYEKAVKIIEELAPDNFSPNPYLYHAVASSIYQHSRKEQLSKMHLEKALETVETDAEKRLLEKKMLKWSR